MKYFLQLVADSLRQRFGTDLSRLTVIFPNKRASLFLNDYLRDSERPIWAPRYMTINEFFQSLSPLRVADPIDTVCRIYAHYVRLTGSDETLDHFYGWGERLLADFDDLDKNLGDASLIFRDLRDYGEIGADEFLTPEQAEQLQRFVSDFSSEERSIVRQRFLSLWQAMPEIYRGLRAELVAEGLAYEGQMFRSVAEALREGTAHVDEQTEYVAFVGFNVLDAVEKELFAQLQACGKALFFWDYDTYYTGPGSEKMEAGTFLAENLRQFPNELTDEADFTNFLSHRGTPDERPLVYASADTETAQAQYVSQWLGAFSDLRGENARRTAVVLCNETLLQPVLHALPGGMMVNVTKGFPMSHTPAFTFLSQRSEKLEEEYHQEVAKAPAKADRLRSAAVVCATLRRLITEIEDEAMRVDEKAGRDEWLRTLYTESYFTAYTTLTRFLHIAESGRLSVAVPTLMRLVRGVLRLSSIAFHGEPAVGLQVMGVLETRCLDFDRVLMLSVGEGNLPQRESDTSFIPFLIRKRYGLTTFVRKTAVYAYYFHRLLQRAGNVCLTFNASTEGMTRGEMSRFMRAMLIDERLTGKIRRIELATRPRPMVIEPDLNVEDQPADRPSKTSFSPTAINTYLSCHRKYYYHYLLHLDAPESTDELIDPRDFGTVFHKAAEIIYGQYLDSTSQPVTPARIRHFVEEEGTVRIAEAVRRAFAEEGVARSSIVEMAIQGYMRKLLHFEGGMGGMEAPVDEFTVAGTEIKLTSALSVPFGPEGGKAEIEIEGTIDRLDVATWPDGVRGVRVIDYKTGGKFKTVGSMDALFASHKHDLPKYPLQTAIYSLLVHEHPVRPGMELLPIRPYIYYVPKLGSKDGNPVFRYEKKDITDIRPLLDEVRSRLTSLLAEIISPDNKFPPTPDETACGYCIYKPLCQRREKQY